MSLAQQNVNKIEDTLLSVCRYFSTEQVTQLAESPLPTLIREDRVFSFSFDTMQNKFMLS